MHSYSQSNEDSFVLDLYKKKNIDNGFFLNLERGMEFIIVIVDYYLKIIGRAVL